MYISWPSDVVHISSDIYRPLCMYVCMYVCIYTHTHIYSYIYIYICKSIYQIIGYIYRMSQEEWTKLRESVPYVELYRYNPKHLYPKLNGYGDNDQRKVWVSGVSTYCTPSVTP